MNCPLDKDKNLFLEGLLIDLKKEHNFNEYKRDISKEETEELFLHRDFFGNVNYSLKRNAPTEVKSFLDIQGYAINKANIHTNYLKPITKEQITSQIIYFANLNDIPIIKDEGQLFLEFAEQQYELNVFVGKVPSDTLNISLKQTFSFNI